MLVLVDGKHVRTFVLRNKRLRFSHFHNIETLQIIEILLGIEMNGCENLVGIILLYYQNVVVVVVRQVEVSENAITSIGND